MFSDGTNIRAVLMALSVFEQLEELCIALQSTSETVSGMMSAVNKVIDFLENCQSEESFANCLPMQQMSSLSWS